MTEVPEACARVHGDKPQPAPFPEFSYAAGTDSGRHRDVPDHSRWLKEFIARYDGQVWLRPVRGYEP